MIIFKMPNTLIPRTENLYEERLPLEWNYLNNPSTPFDFFSSIQGTVRFGENYLVPYRSPHLAGLQHVSSAARLPSQVPSLPNVGIFAYEGYLGNQNMFVDSAQHFHDERLASTDTRIANNFFRSTPHHSVSDPSGMKHTTAALLLDEQSAHGTSIPPLPPGVFLPMRPSNPHQYANHFYPTMNSLRQELMSDANGAGVEHMSSQYEKGNLVSTTLIPCHPNSPHISGPSANNRKLGLYKNRIVQELGRERNVQIWTQMPVCSWRR